MGAILRKTEVPLIIGVLEQVLRVLQKCGISEEFQKVQNLFLYPSAH